MRFLIFLAIVLNSCTQVKISGSISTPGDRDYVDLPELIDEDNKIEEYTEPEIKESKEEKLVRIYESQIGVREKTGKNDGKDVEKYLKSTGLGKGNPWCAAFLKWCLDQAEIKNSVTAYSPSAYSKNRVVWKNGWKSTLKPGHVFTLYYSNLGRIGHTGFVNRKVNDKFVETVEGNTNGEGSREGDGVYKKKRSLNSLFAICNWYK